MANPVALRIRCGEDRGYTWSFKPDGADQLGRETTVAKCIEAAIRHLGGQASRLKRIEFRMLEDGPNFTVKIASGNEEGVAARIASVLTNRARKHRGEIARRRQEEETT